MRRPAALLGMASLLATAPFATAADESVPVAITHATVHVPGGRPPLTDATVVLAHGKVVAVGTNVTPPGGARVLDAHGKVVTAGFIDASATTGIVEVVGEPSANDTHTRADLAPAASVVDAYNPRSIVIPITRAGGVTSVVVTPRGGALAGQGAFIDLAGDTVPEAVVRPALARSRTRGSMRRTGPSTTRTPSVPCRSGGSISRRSCPSCGATSRSSCPSTARATSRRRCGSRTTCASRWCSSGRARGGWRPATSRGTRWP